MKHLSNVCSLSLMGLGASLLLNGCSGNFSFPEAIVTPSEPTQTTAPPIQGSVFGGHAPIVGAHVYVLSPSSSGFAGPGITASTSNQSKSLMCPDTPGTACTATGSGNGAVTSGGFEGFSYVTTDSAGSFNLTGDYSCGVNAEVYIVAVGGTAQFGASSKYAIGNVSIATPTSSTSATMTFTVSQPPEEYYTGETIMFSGFTGSLAVLNGQSGSVVDTSNDLSTTTFDVTLNPSGLTAGNYPATAGAATGLPNANPATINMATLGLCPSSGNFSTAGNGIGSIPFIFMNEVSTAATAYAVAGFGTDAFHIGEVDGDAADGTFTPTGYLSPNTGDPRTSYTKNGLKQAFFNAYNLYDITGSNVSTSFAGEGHIGRIATPQGTGVAPQSTLDTIGNILAACVDSANTSSSISYQCSTLFNFATSNGIKSGSTGAGTSPTDIATAAFNLAHYPAGVGNPNFVNALYHLPNGVVPFTPNLANQPNDFTLEIQWTLLDPRSNANVVSNPTSIAIDGNNYIGGEYPTSSGGSQTGPEEGIFILNGSGRTITKFFARTGLVDTTFNNQTSNYGQADQWHSLAIDFNNNVWITDTRNNFVIETSNYGGCPETSGTPATTPANCASGNPYMIYGYFATGDDFYAANAFVYPFGLAIDSAANVYVSSPGPAAITSNPLYINANGGNIDKLTNAGNNISPTGASGTTPATGNNIPWFSYYGTNTGYNSSGYTAARPGTSAIDNNGIFYDLDASGAVFAFNPANGTVDTGNVGTSFAGGLTTAKASGTAASTVPYNNLGYISVDKSNTVWVTNSDNFGQPQVEGYSVGDPNYLQGSGGGTNTTIVDKGGLNLPCSTAVDGEGTVWVGNAGNASVSAFQALAGGLNATLSPDATSGSTTNTGGFAPLNPTTAPQCAHPAIDRSGNVWLVFQGNSAVSSYVYELVGAAVPTATPIAYSAARKLLGSRP